MIPNLPTSATIWKPASETQHLPAPYASREIEWVAHFTCDRDLCWTIDYVEDSEYRRVHTDAEAILFDEIEDAINRKLENWHPMEAAL